MKNEILIIILIINNTGILYSQNNNKIIDQHQKDSIELQKLEKRIEDLENILLKRKEEEEIQMLLDEAARLSTMEKDEKTDISKKFHSGVRQQQGLNPNISVGGDFFGAVSTSKNDLIAESSEFSLEITECI
jgi:hypothetical protein